MYIEHDLLYRADVTSLPLPLAVFVVLLLDSISIILCHTSPTHTSFWSSSCQQWLTVWLSGSGGAGKAYMNECAFAGKLRSAKKRRSRCPLQPVLLECN